MAISSDIDIFQGTWDYVGDENVDAFMMEIGVNLVMRTLAKAMKPRLIISEKNGKWLMQTESLLMKAFMEFTPDVEFDDKTPDGREIKTIIRVKNGTWENTTRDQLGRQWVVTGYINDQGQQQMVMKSGSITANRWFKRVA